MQSASIFRSLRWRIALPYAALIIATMLGLGLYLSNFIRQNYLDNLDVELSVEARLAADILGPMMANGVASDEIDKLSKSWSKRLGARVTIIAADGVVLGESHTDRAQMDNHGERPEVLQARREGKGSSARFSNTLREYLMYVAVPIYDGEQIIGYARMALPYSKVQSDIAQLQRTLAGVAVLITLIAVILALWIADRSLRPLRDLTRAAVQISSGHLDGLQMPGQAEASAPDEIGQLTRAFNVMAVQLGAQIEALESERSKIAAVLSVMTDGVLIVDGRGQVQLLNPAAESMFQVDQQQALGHSLAEVLRHHQLVELWQKCRSSGMTEYAAVELRPQRLYLQGVAAPLGQALPGNTLMLFQNLTRLRRLETVRQDFISNISHELRTPLASLKALTETLQDGALDDPPAARRFLQRMETEVDALSLMVSELLELSRIESGRVPLKMKPTPPVDLITQAVERLRLQAERADLSINVECSEELPAVLADESRLEQVLVNLLHNAIKFTPAGGRISVEAQLKDDFVLFTVRDTGSGIPAEDLPRIFERFFKSDRARAGGGTGLGLAISRHLVESHGGQIWAESIEGQGSTFYFTIPLAH
ncbi:MAG: HAMP domain-containing protein [Anaerolineales bacterium]|nr:HAMP domain-containing protein [Anaerolineales bacterium]